MCRFFVDIVDVHFVHTKTLSQMFGMVLNTSYFTHIVEVCLGPCQTYMVALFAKDSKTPNGRFSDVYEQGIKNQ